MQNKLRDMREETDDLRRAFREALDASSAEFATELQSARAAFDEALHAGLADSALIQHSQKEC